MSTSSNDRAIALCSIISTFSDKIIIEKQTEHLLASDLQFCYEGRSSTVMCTVAFTETIDYYVSKNSLAYVLFIDASKAFDRVSHIKLFKVLHLHCICPLSLQSLFNM